MLFRSYSLCRLPLSFVFLRYDYIIHLLDLLCYAKMRKIMYYKGESRDLNIVFAILDIYPKNAKAMTFEKRSIFARMGARMGKL